MKHRRTTPLAKLRGALLLLTLIALFISQSASAVTIRSITISSAMHNYVIGETYGGGIVAYILVSGDPGYSATVQHGLIAATADQNTRIIWAVSDKQNTFVSGNAVSTDTAIGTGLANTNLIIAQNGAGTSYAAGLARAYTGGSYSDWYLPSKNELNKLNLKNSESGVFVANAYYWSSSEDNATRALSQYFSEGRSISIGKDSSVRVRAVRSF